MALALQKRARQAREGFRLHDAERNFSISVVACFAKPSL